MPPDSVPPIGDQDSWLQAQHSLAPDSCAGEVVGRASHGGAVSARGPRADTPDHSTQRASFSE